MIDKYTVVRLEQVRSVVEKNLTADDAIRLIGASPADVVYAMVRESPLTQKVEYPLYVFKDFAGLAQ
jgi:hypothetical protein